jgi:ElaB/YqjD/DUF883 family membrane-anchored ribosome-binding protein
MNYGKTTPDKALDTASTYGKQVSSGVENVVDSARDMAQGALDSASEKVESLHDKAKPVVDRIVARGHEIADNAIAGTRDAGVRAKRAVSSYAHACESYVVEQPMKSVAIAAAAGAAVAALVVLSRSRARERARYNGH